MVVLVGIVEYEVRMYREWYGTGAEDTNIRARLFRACCRGGSSMVQRIRWCVRMCMLYSAGVRLVMGVCAVIFPI